MRKKKSNEKSKSHPLRPVGPGNGVLADRMRQLFQRRQHSDLIRPGKLSPGEFRRGLSRAGLGERRRQLKNAGCGKCLFCNQV